MSVQHQVKFSTYWFLGGAEVGLRRLRLDLISFRQATKAENYSPYLARDHSVERLVKSATTPSPWDALVLSDPSSAQDRDEMDDEE